MSDTNGTASNDTPTNGVAHASASPAGSGSVAEGSTAAVVAVQEQPVLVQEQPVLVLLPTLSAPTDSTPRLAVGRKRAVKMP